MAEGFEAVVALYLKMGNYAGLEQQREHRLRLLDQLANQPSFTATRKTIQQDIDILDRALSERLKKSNIMRCIDIFTDQKIAGWIFYKDFPEIPVVLEIFLDATRIASITADTFREDLLKAGLGQGKCSFTFKFPDSLDGATTISVRTSTGRTIAQRQIGHA